MRSMKGLRNVLVATLASDKASECHLNNGMMNLDKVGALAAY